MLVACKKDDDQQLIPFPEDETEEVCINNCVLFEGILKEVQSQEPIPGAEIWFEHYVGTWAIPSITVDSDVTGEDGTYSVNFEGYDIHGDIRFPLSAYYEKEGYLPKSGLLESIELDSNLFDTMQHLNFEIYKSSLLRVQVQSAGETTFSFLNLDCTFDLPGIPNRGIIMHGGGVIDTLVTFDVPADLNTHFAWYTLGEGGEDLGELNIVVPRDSVKTIMINIE